MISNSYSKPNYTIFAAEKNIIGGSSLHPNNEIAKPTENIHSKKEQILRLNALQKLSLGIKKVTKDIPDSMIRGLQGDRTVNFNDFLQMALVPYYLGGAMLYNCFRAGGDIKTAKKQGVGIVLYYLGVGLGNNFVDSFVKHKFGIDLNLAYKASDGRIHKVFESVDFTRWDLLEEKDWQLMGDRLGIPRDIVDRDTAIKEEVTKILVKARAWKLVLGSTFAAIGAGFIARNKVWEGLFANSQALKTTFKNLFTGSGKSLIDKLKECGSKLVSVFKAEVVSPMIKSLEELPKAKLGNVPVGLIAMLALVALPLYSLISLMKTPSKDKAFLTADEAMPISTKIENDPLLRQQISSQINPNKFDYEALYSQAAKPVLQSNFINQTRQTSSPFEVFELFMKKGQNG